MKQRITKQAEDDGPTKRGGSVGWFGKLIFFGFIVFVVVNSAEVFINDGVPSLREMFGIAFLSSTLLLARPGLVFGSIAGCYVLDVPWKFRTEEEKSGFKSFLVKRAKREGMWYSGTILLWLAVYQWTPFAGHVDIFFMLTIGVPLVFFLIGFILRLAFKGCSQHQDRV